MLEGILGFEEKTYFNYYTDSSREGTEVHNVL